jgi:hypothetical protein
MMWFKVGYDHIGHVSISGGVLEEGFIRFQAAGRRAQGDDGK